jgi:hypothetical protein
MQFPIYKGQNRFVKSIPRTSDAIHDFLQVVRPLVRLQREEDGRRVVAPKGLSDLPNLGQLRVSGLDMGRDPPPEKLGIAPAVDIIIDIDIIKQFWPKFNDNT